MATIADDPVDRVVGQVRDRTQGRHPPGVERGVDRRGILLGVDQRHPQAHAQVPGNAINELTKAFQVRSAPGTAARAEHNWTTNLAATVDHDPQVSLQGYGTLRILARSEIHGSHIGASRVAADQMRLPLQAQLEAAIGKTEPNDAIGQQPGLAIHAAHVPTRHGFPSSTDRTKVLDERSMSSYCNNPRLHDASLAAAMTTVSHADHGRITDASVAATQRWLGVERVERGWNQTASADAIWHFAQGVGDDNPLWWDPDYSAGTRWSGIIAPPLFVSTCANAGEAPGQQGIYPAEAWFPGTLPIWVSDRWIFHRPIHEGEAVVATARLASVDVRAGRDGQPIATHVDHTSYLTADGTPLAECFKTLNRYERRRGPAAALPEISRPTYTDAELARIDSQYAAEPASRRGAATRYGDDVAVGDALCTLVKGPLTITNVVGFVMGWGSPMCRTNRVAYQYLAQHPGARLRHPDTNVPDTLEGPHWDPALARAGGNADAYDFGLQRVCWIGHLLTDWCGDDGTVTTLEARLRRPNLIGDTTWLTGTVVALAHHDDVSSVTCSASGTNQHGEETVSATATISLPRRR